MTRTLLIRADASTEMGTGHIMRCFALAQAWMATGGRATLATQCANKRLLERFASGGLDVVQLPRSHPDPADLFRTIALARDRRAIWVVADGYHFDLTYQQGIRAAGLKLLLMDDFGNLSCYGADILLNQNIDADRYLYPTDSVVVRLLGPRYALLRKEFTMKPRSEKQIEPVARHIMVTMGGGDPDNMTAKVVAALRSIDDAQMRVRIVIGPVFPGRLLLAEAIEGDDRFLILPFCDDMPGLMEWADLAVSAAGSTCWELLYMGVPFVLVALAENQRGLADELGRRNLAVNLGWHAQTDEFLVQRSVESLRADPTRRRLMSYGGRNLVDGNGARLVLQEINCWGVNE